MTSPAATPAPANPGRHLVVAISLASAGLASWEVGLTRLAGLLYTRTLAYQALAIGLLGLGMGAWWAARRRRDAVSQSRRALVAIAPTLLAGAALCTQHDMAWALCAFAWPFVVFGAAMAAAWRACRPGGAPARQRQYRWELVGAAGGLAVIGPASVAWAGSVGAAWSGASLCAIGALWAAVARRGDDEDAGSAGQAERRRRRRLTGIALVSVAGCAAGCVATGLGHAPFQVPLLRGPGIGIHLRHVAARERSPRVETHFSPWARTDWLRADATDMSWVFVEGRFVARSVAWDGQSKMFKSKRVTHLARLKRLQWRIRGAARTALIIGAGAGFDVAVALQEGAAHVTAVELNPATIAFTREDGPRNGHIYDRPDVRVIAAEGRRWLASHAEQFDAIQLALMDTAPGGVRGLATAHSRLWTTEATALWRSRLRPGGVLALLFNTTPAWRTAAQQLLQRPDGGSVGDVERTHVWGARVPGARSEVDPFCHVLLYSPTPWTAGERSQLDDWARQVGAVATDALDPPSVLQPWSDRALTDDRPIRVDPRRDSLALLLALFAAVLSILLAGRSGPIARPRLAATGAGAALAWLQVGLVEWFTAATGAPALALGAAIAAMLLGAAAGTMVPWRRSGPWLAAGAAALVGVALPRLIEPATQWPMWLAALTLGGAVATLSLPFGTPWITALQYAARSVPSRGARRHAAAGEGFVVAADGLGAVLGAGTSGLLIQTVGLRGTCWVAAAALLAVAALLRPHR